MIKIKSEVNNIYNKFQFYRIPWPTIDKIEYKPSIFEWNGLEFYYISKLGGFIVPEGETLDTELLEKDEFFLEDWNLEKISESPNPNFILNHYTRGEITYPSISVDKVDHIEGEWLLKNKDLDVSIEFSIMISKDYYSTSTKRVRLCYPEKTEIPYDPVRIINKSDFILYFLWTKLLLKK